MRHLLVVVLTACGGAPPPRAAEVAPTVVAPVVAPRHATCEFDGAWRGPLRFGAAQAWVTAESADARLSSTRLEAHARGDGWHLDGHANLGEDHVLVMSEATWLGEGVAVRRGYAVAVMEAAEGRLRVSPLPATLAHMDLAELPERWLGCEAVSLAGPERQETPEALELPPVGGTWEIELPLSLSHTAGGEPFVEVRRNAHERADVPLRVRVQVHERDANAARIRVERRGGTSSVLLVGWVEAGRLHPLPPSDGLARSEAISRGPEHEDCEASRELTLYIEDESGRSEAGRVDAGARMRVIERIDGQARVLPPLRSALSISRGLLVNSAGLRCAEDPG